jgi:ankyrin repeat protein
MTSPSSVLSPELIRDFVLSSHGNLKKVETLLAETPALLNAQHDWGEGGFEDGLGAAAHVGNRAIAEFLLEKGAPLTICAAAMLGRVDDVKAFLAADPLAANARGAHGITLMFHTALSGNVTLARILQEAGCKEGYSHALHAAISYGHLEMVQWLLEHGAKEVNALDYQGKTPLTRALDTQRTDIADLLREYGASESA